MSDIKIWVSDWGMDYINVSDLADPKNDAHLTFTSADMTKCGYTQVGTGKVECSFFTRDEIQQSAIDSLKAQVQKVKAEAEKEVMQLQDKINQLLAITNEA